MPPHPPPPPDTPLAGELLLTFNGETSAGGVDMAAAVRYALADVDGHGAADAAALFADALGGLSTTASSSLDDAPPVAVRLSVHRNDTAPQPTLMLVVDLDFHPHSLVSSPLNLGALPLVQLDTSGVVGVLGATVVPLQKGAVRRRPLPAAACALPSAGPRPRAPWHGGPWV